jgi:hypothetical protein
MPITHVTRFRGKMEDAVPLAKQAGPLIKRYGATSVVLGYCHSGAHTGQISLVAIFPDWATYGRAWQGISDDPEYRRLLSESLRVAELMDRSVIVTQEV